MSLIVAGRFPTFLAAEAAARQLFAAGFVEEDVSLFFVNPRGQHAHRAADTLESSPLSFKPVKHPGRGALLGAVAGAVVGVGLFAPLAASMVVAIVAAGVGAYVGSIAGATVQARANSVLSIEEAMRHTVHREFRDSGVLLAVHVCPENQLQAADVLRRAGSLAVEGASGRWQHGRWADFDPTTTPVPITELTQREA